MKNIVIVTDAWHPQINGVVRTLDQTVTHLRKMDFEVIVIDPGVFKTFPCPTYPEIFLAWDIWRVGNMLEKCSPQYLHIATEGPLGLAAKIWADRRKIAYTTSYHTKYPEYIVNYFGFGLRLGYKVITWFHGRSKSVMVNTDSMKLLLEKHGLRDISIWDRGVDTDLFCQDGEVPELFSRLSRPILLNVGRVAVEKNLTAFYDMPFVGSKVQVGGGPMLDAYRQKYLDVHFVGSKSGAELASYYRGADVFVFPSKSDTYGLVMLESIASGVPVAGYPVHGPKDVIIEGLTGALDENLAVATSHALEMRQNDLRGWALSKSWKACTEGFVANLVATDL